MIYYKYKITNPKIKQMILSLVKYKQITKDYDMEFMKVEKILGCFYSSEYDVLQLSKVRGYMKESLVDKEGQDVSLEELITFILK